MDMCARAYTPLVAHDSTLGSVEFAPGGVGRNIAENLARLGVPVELLSVVGDDDLGQQLRTRTAATGVDVRCVVRLAGQRTASYFAIHAPDGDMAWAVNDMRILEQLTPDFYQRHSAALQPDAWLLLDCNLPEATLAALLRLPRTTVLEAVSAVKCRRARGHLAGLHLLKLNQLEAQAMTDLTVQTPADALLAAQALCKLGVQHCVISLGAQGVAWCNPQGITGFLPAKTVPVVNTTGAGDALLAGIVAALLRQCTLPEAVAYGMGCAEITLSSTFANSCDLNHANVLQHLQAIP
jgi:pseudouridine kinase